MLSQKNQDFFQNVFNVKLLASTEIDSVSIFWQFLKLESDNTDTP